jgi:3-phosphoshikimate 1-carboxyvinyltransferase
MDFQIKPVEALTGVIEAPASKSYTIRALFLSSLATGISKIKSPLKSRDTEAAYNACKLFGAKIQRKKDYTLVDGTSGEISAPKVVVDSMNSGTSIRIATALASLADENVMLTGDESVRRRPILPLLEGLRMLGVSATSNNGFPPHSVKGPLIGGKAEIPGNVSSQFLSAILMSSPYAKSDVEVELTTELKSRPYVDMSIEMIKRFGVKIEELNKGFKVAANQSYTACDYTVEGDYSSAAFILAAAALTKSDVTVKNLMNDSLQADRKIVEVLSQMGAEIKVGGDSVKVKSDGNLNGLVVDLSDSPDLVPIVSALGACAAGKTEIVNAEHARLKECDRISAMAAELQKLKVKVDEREDGLLISGGKPSAATVDGWFDHRVIMALSVLALKADGVTKIEGAEHVDVTFPDFRDVMVKLGADIR